MCRSLRCRCVDGDVDPELAAAVADAVAERLEAAPEPVTCAPGDLRRIAEKFRSVHAPIRVHA